MAHHIPNRNTVAGSSSAHIRALSISEPFLKPLIPERAPDFNKNLFVRWLEAGTPLNR